MMLGMVMTLDSLLVNGAATDASPSLMVGGSFSSSSASIICCDSLLARFDTF
jgi:hypothetical protein